ncbi:MAG TPA: hypothetical protein PKX00_14415 [Opitutaceae bacterium]|nr:hypothetical protein [Opitutaceae bacterium]
MMRRMRCLLFLLLGAGASVWGQSNVEFANLREDVRLAVQRVGELSLRVEQLERAQRDGSDRIARRAAGA